MIAPFVAQLAELNPGYGALLGPLARQNDAVRALRRTRGGGGDNTTLDLPAPDAPPAADTPATPALKAPPRPTADQSTAPPSPSDAPTRPPSLGSERKPPAASPRRPVRDVFRAGC